MYIPNSFILQELVWRKCYEIAKKANLQWALWRKFDDRFLITIDQFAKDFGTTIINSWYFGKLDWLGNQIFEYSGARPYVLPIGENWGSRTMHLDWNTGDLKVKKFSILSISDKKQAYNDARDYIIEHKKKYPYVTVLESEDYSPTWIHLSTGNFNHGDGSIRIVKPS